MSFLVAERKGKAGDEENRVTSGVFGSLDIVDRIVLKRILNEWGLELDNESVEGMRIDFWKEYSGGGEKAEPDVILRRSDLLMFVEVKVGSPLDEGQLWREYRAGSGKAKDFKLLLLTNDTYCPPEIDRVRGKLITERGEKQVDIRWMRWPQVYRVIKESEKNADGLERKILGEVRKFLEKKNLRGFLGFQEDDVQSLGDAVKVVDESIVLLRDLDNTLGKEGFRPVGSRENNIYSQHSKDIKQAPNWYERFFPTYMSRYYYKPSTTESDDTILGVNIQFYHPSRESMEPALVCAVIKFDEPTKSELKNAVNELIPKWFIKWRAYEVEEGFSPNETMLEKSFSKEDHGAIYKSGKIWFWGLKLEDLQSVKDLEERVVKKLLAKYQEVSGLTRS